MAITTREELDRLLETPLRRQIIIPLLQKMGMHDVRDNHGVTELGKDVVGWFPDPIGTAVNTVIVAKAGNITGSVSQEVARQIGKAFRTPFATALDNTERVADQVWVVTNGTIPEMSRKSIQSEVELAFASRIRWLDGDELWKRWTDHFPVTLEQIRAQLQEHAKEISDPAVMAREWVDEHGRGIEVRVKDPSQLTERHTKGQVNFSFPDTPEGREAKENFLRHLRTGEPLELSGEHFTLRLPEVLEQIVNDAQVLNSDASSRLIVSSAESPHRLPVKIEVICDDGDRAGLDYVEWRILQAGTEEITFVNDQQAIPIRIKMVFPNFASDGRYEFYPAEGPLSAGWSVKAMDLQRCLTKTGVIKITLLNSGKVMSTSPHTANQPVDFTDEEYDLFVQLSAVEQIVGQPIVLPEAGLTERDVESIHLLFHLLRIPEVEEEWNGAELEYLLEDPDPQMQHLLGGGEAQASIPGDRTVSLGTQTVHLGPVVQKVESFRLADIEETRRHIRIIEGIGSRQSVYIPVVPGSSTKMRTTYLDWVDAEPATPYRQSKEATAE